MLKLGTVLGGSNSLSDRLVLSGPGASASGNTTLRITNLGGLGALTTGNGIEVVSARNGATTTAQTTRDAFTLANGHVDAGAYEYRLYAADAQGAGENWYLRSETAAAGHTGPATPRRPRRTPPIPSTRPVPRNLPAPRSREPADPFTTVKLPVLPHRGADLPGRSPAVRRAAGAAAPGRPRHARQPAPPHRRRGRARWPAATRRRAAPGRAPSTAT